LSPACCPSSLRCEAGVRLAVDGPETHTTGATAVLAAAIVLRAISPSQPRAERAEAVAQGFKKPLGLAWNVFKLGHPNLRNASSSQCGSRSLQGLQRALPAAVAT
ncbi:MAG: hypothetical protein WBM08_08245, partial [Prochlorococcaceae cyanobacterium]